MSDRIPEQNKQEPMNLTKRLSTSGAASRRKAAELIKEGAVTVNGTVETNPATIVKPSDRITLNGKEIESAPELVYIMLNKPRGYVCTNEDIHAKKKAVDLIRLRNEVRLFSAGRLDKDSEGLIIFTNDGKFADRLMHPRNEVMKTYALSVAHPFAEEQLQQMVDGIQDDGETLSAEEVYQRGDRKYILVLAEGKKREIRRMVAALGNETKRLERIAIGNLKRGMLKPGEWRMMTRRDVAQILMLEEDDPEVMNFSRNLNSKPFYNYKARGKQTTGRPPRRPSGQRGGNFRGGRSGKQ